MTATAPYLGELRKNSPSNWGKWGENDGMGSLKVAQGSGSPVNPVAIK